jgi:toxin ParE1/3/4
MHSVIISFEADQDLFDILEYTEETFGEPQKLIYYSQFKNAFEKLAKMPTIGHSRSDIPLDTFALSVEKHTIIYEVIEDDKLVQILRILHSKMDFDVMF